MNINDIIQQIVRMKGLMPEVNRTTIAIRFQTMVTDSMKTMFGDDDEKTLNWLNHDSENFLKACQLVAPRAPISAEATAPSTFLAEFVDKWEAANTWRLDENKDWQAMCQETLNVKATMLRDLREIINASKSNESAAPGEESGVQ